MAAEPEVKVKITADADGVVVATTEASESVKKFGKNVRSLAKEEAAAQQVTDSLADSTEKASEANVRLGRSSKGAADGAGKVGEAIQKQKAAADSGAKATEKLAEMHQKMATTARNAGLGMVAMGATVTAALGGMAKVTMDFEASLRNVNSIAKESEASFRRTFDTLAGLGPRLGTNKGPRELAEALYDINSSGYTGAEGLKVLESAAKAGAAGMADAKDAAAVITQSLNAYGEGADQATHYADVMFKTVEAGVVNFQELSQYLGIVTSTAKGTGISFEETNAALAVLTQRGARASTAVDGLRMLITQLSAPTGEAQKVLDQYGVQAGEAALRTKGLVGVVAELYQKTGGNKVALRKALGDVNAADAAAKLVGPDQGSLFRQRIGEFGQADGAMEAALAEQRKGVLFQLQQAWAAIQGFGITALAALQPYVTPIIGMINQVTRAMLDMSPGMKAAAAAVAILSAAFLTVGGTILATAPSIMTMVASVTAAGGLAAVLAPIGAAIAGVATAIASAALPIAAAVAAIVAAAAAMKYAWDRNWGGIQEKTTEVVSTVKEWLVDGFDRVKTAVSAAWSATWRAVETGFTAFMEWIKPAVMDVVAFFSEVWAIIEDDYTEMMSYLAPIAKGALGYLYNTIVPALQAIWQVFKIVWSEVVGIVRVAWTLVKGIVVTLVTSIRDLFRVGMALVQGDWKGAWDGMKDWVTNFGVNVLDTITNVLDTVKSAWAEFIGTAYNAGRDIMQAFSDGLKGRERAVADAGTAVGEAAARVAMREAAGPRLAAHLARQEAPPPTAPAPVAQGPTKPPTRPPTRQTGAGLPEIPPTLPDLPEAPPPAAAGPRRDVRSSQTDAGERVAQAALARVGTSFLPGQVAQCANFVRAIYGAAGVKVGASTQPVDREQTRGLPQGPGYANSFVGQDVGQIITDRRQLKPGDVVTYRNTYGAFPAGSLTHAGIYTGEGQIVHRPSRGGTVVRAGLDDPGPFAYGVRPYSLMGEGARETARQDTVDRLREWREQLRELATDHDTLGARLAKVDERYAKMATEGAALGASRADLAKVEAARQAEHLAAWTEHADKQKTLLAEMSAQRLELVGTETDREREELRQRFEAMVQHWQKVAAETPALAAQAEEQIALVRQTAAARQAEFERQAALKKVQDEQQTWEQRFQQDMAGHEFQLQMGRETQEQLLAFLGEQLNAWQGTEEGKRTLALRYREAFLEDLRVRREAQDAYDVADLERELAQLQAKTELEVAEEVRRDALLSEVREAQMNNLAAMRQRAQDVADSMRNSFQQSFTGILSGQQTVGQGIKGIWDAVKQAFLQAIAEMIIKTQAFQAVLMALKALMNSIGGIFGGLFGFHTGGVVEASGMPYAVAHTGGLLGPGGELQSFHTGGSVGRVRLRPDEVLAKLQTGEVVLSRDNVRNLGRSGGTSSGGGFSVTINAPGLVVREEADIGRIGRALGGDLEWRLGLA